MLKKIFISTLLFSTLGFSYTAEVYPLDKKTDKPVFLLELDEKKVGSTIEIDSRFKLDDKDQLKEFGRINEANAEILEYKVTQIQTKEKGLIQIFDNTIKITYQAEGKPDQIKEIKKPKVLVAPANFERWLKVNFEMLKKEKTTIIDFLIWDRMETLKFKVSYLGLVEAAGKKQHEFKMNIDNFLIASFISPIKITMSEDMTKILRFRGRLGVKQKDGASGYKDFDGDVIYFH